MGAWSADPSDATDGGLVGQTARTILTPHLGGDAVRVRLSNRLGPGPVAFGAATIGLRRGRTGAALAAGSRRGLTFAGAGAVTVPAGAEVTSDPVALAVTGSSELAVSLFVAAASGPATEHVVGQQTSYFSPPGSGDHTGDDGGAAFTLPTTARYFVSGVDVRTPGSTGAVVAFGDSITDGFGGPPDRNDRYSDLLARRLAASGSGASLSVVNAGISGNRILSEAHPPMGGPSGLARLAGDVIAEPGVSDVIVLEGINDLGGGASAEAVIEGLKTIVARLAAAGLGVQLGTLTPFGGSPALGPASGTAEAARAQVNRFIRTSGGPARAVDFDAAVRDPADPSRLRPRYDSGDHVHPNGAGRRAMAAAVDLAGLHAAACRSGQAGG